MRSIDCRRTPSKQWLVAIPLRIHAQSLYREDELIVRVRNHTALIEDALNSLLQPFSIGLLPRHNELERLFYWFEIGISCFNQCYADPCSLYYLRSCWMLDVFALFTSLLVISVASKEADWNGLPCSSLTSHHPVAALR